MLIFPIKNKVYADDYIDCLKNNVLPLHEVFQRTTHRPIQQRECLYNTGKLAPTISGLKYHQKFVAHFEEIRTNPETLEQLWTFTEEKFY